MTEAEPPKEEETQEEERARLANQALANQCFETLCTAFAERLEEKTLVLLLGTLDTGFSMMIGSPQGDREGAARDAIVIFARGIRKTIQQNPDRVEEFCKLASDTLNEGLEGEPVRGE